MDRDARITELQRKIDIEQTVRDGAAAMRAKLTDPNAIAQCDASLLESTKRLEFLHAQLARLTLGSGSNGSNSTTASPPNEPAAPPARSPSLPAVAVSVAVATPLGLPAAVSVESLAPSTASSTKSSLSGLFNYFRRGKSRSASTTSLDKHGHVALAHQWGPPLADLVLQGPTAGGPRAPLPGEDAEAPDLDESASGTVSNLDWSQAGRPLSNAKLAAKLRDLTYKLDLEYKVKQASERMEQLYAAPGAATATAKTERAEVERTQVETIARIDAIKRALQNYSGLYVPTSASVAASNNGDDVPSPPPIVPGHDGHDDHLVNTIPSPAAAAAAGAMTLRRAVIGTKKPLTGDLTIDLVVARLPPSVKNAQSRALADVYLAMVRVDGVTKLTSKPFKAPKDRTGSETEIPFSESYTLSVDKAMEIEIVIVDADRSSNVRAVEGLLWFRLADLMAPPPTATPPPAEHHDDAAASGPVSTSMTPASGARVGWFDLDPVGTVLVRAQFTPKAKARKVSRLGRQGAVRKKQKVETTLHGHRFALAQFANITKCALCSEFIGLSSCYACEACGFSCHKKCAPRVVTRCFAVPAADGMQNEEGLLQSHNIPHRFQPFTNLSANWCVHCGHLIPLGRGHVKCADCGAMSHAACSVLVPNFCGLSMKMANTLLHEMKMANDQRAANEIRKLQRVSQTPSQAEIDLTIPHVPDTPVPPVPAAHEMPVLPPKSPTSPTAMPELTLPPVPGYQPRRDSQIASINLAAAAAAAKAGNPWLASPSGSPSLSAAPAPQPVVPPVVLSPKLPSTATTPAAVAPPVTLPAPASSPMTTTPSKRTKKVTLDDFVFLSVLGKGNFGKVMLAEEKHSKKLYAIKVLKKEFVIENDEVESTRSEKRILLTANRARHPFLINLYACMQTATRLYFVMEYVSGGDLMLHIQRQQFSERRAKFYAAEVLLALEFLHQNNIVYRDLKLDNIMLGPDGHIKLADYGLCKENMPFGAVTNTFCGTPEFMAPEILQEKTYGRYGRAVDWWAFGVLVYEMICGQAPFHGDDEDEIFESILHDEVLYPINMSRDAVALCQRLLTKDPSQRLGATAADAEDIKRHAFFRGVDWDALARKQIAPPFVPRLTSATDTSNFDTEFTREPPQLTPIHTVLDEVEQAEFLGFSYVADWVNETAQG
ncbi:Serine/threonine kinase [Allomyces arbusculus]|nr:Serine/threonine kinase [Allomyces arbusculus]